MQSHAKALRPQRILLCVLALFASGRELRSEAVTIRLENSVFKVLGWQQPLDPQRLGELFAVYVAEGSDRPPLLGSYNVEGGALIFRPRFPLQPGLRYRAVFKPTDTVASFDIPKPETASTVVERVYPSAGVLPENQLKFYVHFSAPMGRGEAYRRVRLLDESGRRVELPFLELEQELWDRDGKRLTILFDPGRIKRGLVPYEEVGVPLRAGHSYTLVIDRDWRDAQGQPLREEFRKRFRVGPADRQPPDPMKWRITPPKSGASDALVLEFPEPLDHALLEHFLQVTGPNAKPVPGSISVDREETRWRFTPREPWTPGSYSILVVTTLEDLAGNRIGRPFDVDVFERVDDQAEVETVSLPFRVAP